MIISAKDIFKKSLNIYKNNFAKIAVAILAVWLPLVLIQGLIVEPSLEIDGLNEILNNPELRNTEQYENAVLASSRPMMIYMLMNLIISFLGIVSDITIIKIASEAHKNELNRTELSFSDFFSEAIPVLPRCIWVLVLTSLLVAGGIMFFILPGIYIYVMSALAITAAVLVKAKGFRAIRISFDVVRKEIFTVAFVLLLLIVVNSSLAFAVDSIAKPFSDKTVITATLNGILSLACKFTTAVQVVFFTILFKERTKVISSEPSQDTNPAEVQ